MKTAHEMWTSFETSVLDPDASAIQRQETKRAFMAGVWGLLQNLRDMGCDDSVDEDAGSEQLTALENELERFQKDVLAGRQ